MPEKHLFEYAIIRVVPCVEREEFMNVGVILYCPSQQFLKTMFEVNKTRLNMFSSEITPEEIKERLSAFQMVCAGSLQGGIIGRLPIAARFRWLTATRSTVLQTSKVHPGLCSDAAQTLLRLHTSLVV